MNNRRMERVIGILKGKLPLVVVLLIVVLVPLGMGDYWVHTLTEVAILSLFALSFNLLFGHTGLFSFGQAAYFGTGAYAAVILISKAGVPFLLSIPAAAFIAALWALIGGIFCVRLSGIYFAIMTVVITQITFVVMFKWYSVTGGPDGIQGGAPPEMLIGTLPFYYFTLAVVILAIVGYWFIVKSPFGTTLHCIRDNPERTLFLGVPVRKYMLIAFVVAGFYAGLSGAMYGIFTHGATPFYCDFMKSGDPIFMTVIGGIYSFAGPIVGAAIWVFLDAFVSSITEYWLLVTGSLILVVIIFMRQGVVGILEKGLQHLRRRSRNKASPIKEDGL